MKNFWKIIIALAVVLLLLAAAIYFLGEKKESGMKVLFMESWAEFAVEIADNPLARARGLMWRESLPADSGMLFVFTDEAKRSFWMKNTLIPLDLIFVSASGKIVDIKNNFAPCPGGPCESYVSAAPAKYVLEINAGQTAVKGLKIGEQMVVE
jgi:uncharacterized protein